jgi:hypothetical protein
MEEDSLEGVPLAHARAGDKQGGCVRVLYDTTLSTRGVLLAAGRKPRTQDPFDFQVGGPPLPQTLFWHTD